MKKHTHVTGSDSIEEDVSSLINAVNNGHKEREAVSAMTSVETNASLAMEREKGRIGTINLLDVPPPLF